MNLVSFSTFFPAVENNWKTGGISTFHSLPIGEWKWKNSSTTEEHGFCTVEHDHATYADQRAI
jgi:hypothetical protein